MISNGMPFATKEEEGNKIVAEPVWSNQVLLHLLPSSILPITSKKTIALAIPGVWIGNPLKRKSIMQTNIFCCAFLRDPYDLKVTKHTEGLKQVFRAH